jgi:hypothetical protein
MTVGAFSLLHIEHLMRKEDAANPMCLLSAGALDLDWTYNGQLESTFLRFSCLRLQSRDSTMFRD